MELYYESSLAHHGVKGQKWGVRRYQNTDGTLTEAGKKKYVKAVKKMDKLDTKAEKRQMKAVRKKYSWATSSERAKQIKYKADKSTYKAAKWYNKVKKNFGEQRASEMKNSRGVSMGERYTNWLIYGT